MNEGLKLYLQYLADKDVSNNTIIAYERDLNKLLGFLSEKGIKSFAAVDFMSLNSYILFLEKNGASMATVSRNISSIKSFFGFLLRKGIITTEPALELKAPKGIKKRPEILTTGEMNAFLDSIDVGTDKGIRDKAMLELLYATGMRVFELINLKITDVNFVMDMVSINDNGKPRVVPFGEHTKIALMNYVKDVRDRLNKNNLDNMFLNFQGGVMTRQGFWKIVKGYGENFGIADRLNPNIFRHSFAAHMVENGADLKSVQELLGHADISTTLIYSSFVNTRAQNVYKNTHPRQ